MINLKLLGGASLFGAGWALSGLCPGPAIIALMSMSAEMVVFFSTMLGGMLVQHSLEAVSVSRIVSELNRSDINYDSRFSTLSTHRYLTRSIGRGGSILAVPMLTYAAGLSPRKQLQHRFWSSGLQRWAR